MSQSSLQFFLGVLATLTLFVVTYRLKTRISIGEDFALARGRLPAWLCGLSQATNCLPLWLLIAVMLHAYSIGLGAIWTALACLLGQAINWWLIAPRLRALAATQGCYSISQLIAANVGERMQSLTLRSAALIVICALGLTSVTFLQWAAHQWVDIVGGSFVISVILLGLALYAIATFGGLWSASSSDAAQAVVVLAIIFIVAIVALIKVGGIEILWSGLQARDHLLITWFNGYSGVLALAFFVGVLFIAFGGSAQPQVISRYLACKDSVEFKRARNIALVWTLLVLLCALLLGWCTRLLINDPSHAVMLLQSLLPITLTPLLASLCTALILIAFSVASLSLWIAMATHLATDFRRLHLHPADAPSTGLGLSLLGCRWGLFGCALSVILGAIYLPSANDNQDRLWFCWQALSAAFAPLLVVRLTGKKVRPGSSLGAIWAGFILTLLFHLMPNTAGDILERSLPFIASIGIALSGGERRRNSDRADRGDKTVHDHLPI